MLILLYALPNFWRLKVITMVFSAILVLAYACYPLFPFRMEVSMIHPAENSRVERCHMNNAPRLMRKRGSFSPKFQNQMPASVCVCVCVMVKYHHDYLLKIIELVVQCSGP